MMGAKFLVIVLLVVASSGCAHWCKDANRREGAWGFVFRCSTDSAAPERPGGGER